jgi:beta-glucanase (GH16 family)
MAAATVVVGAIAITATVPSWAAASHATGSAPTTAAERYDWGDPLPGPSDEFDYGSADDPAVPDTSKWELAGGGEGQCWEGHAGNGQRCDKNTRVYGGVLRMTGEANGDSGWLGSTDSRQYGRYEARVRSMNTGDPGDRQYHPLLLIWPDTDNDWPQDGEYDYLENGAPGEDCAEGYLHYPQDPDADIQQEHAQDTDCGSPLSEWHTIGFEWTPDHVAGFIDGKEWFKFSGGENDVRKCVQCMPIGYQTIQLDNFYGDGMTPAQYEVDWYREYAAP